MSNVPNLNLKQMKLDELEQMRHEISRQIEREQQMQKKKALEEIKNIVRQHDLSYDEVVQAVRVHTKRGKAPPIYRNPERPRQTWSGKGEPPDWFKQADNPEELRIPGA